MCPLEYLAHPEDLHRLKWHPRARVCALPVTGWGVARGGSAEEGVGPLIGVGDCQAEGAACVEGG